MPPTFRRSIHMSVAVLAFCIAFISAVVRFIVWQKMESSVEHSIQAAELEAMLDEGFSILQDAETGQRGYLLTGDPAYLEPYEQARARLPVHQAMVDGMLSGQPAKLKIFADWKTAAAAKLAGLQMTVKTYQEQGPAAPGQVTGWAQAAAKLRRMEISSWPALLKTLAITEAQTFAGRLQSLADANDCSPLRTYAEELRAHADRYAADDMERHLAAFPQLIALLEERISQIHLHAPE